MILLMNEHLTVKQLSELAKVSVRTLHYYDEIGLLKPSSIGANKYRYYNTDAIYRLQQILLYREMGFSLMQIKGVLDNPRFDRLSALKSHRQSLLVKRERLDKLVKTVEATILHLNGVTQMSKVELFQGFDEEKQKQYEEEARGQWGETVETSVQRWGSYDKRRQQEILTEGDAIYANIAANMAKGPESNDVQLLLTQWHAHIRNFYEPSTEMLAGLGDMYHDHPEFNANFAAIHPELPSFLKLAIAHYVHSLT